MKRMGRSFVVSSVALALLLSGPSAQASPFEKRLRRGDKGKAVKALQVRLAGWSPQRQAVFRIDGRFGTQTVKAVRAFKTEYRLGTNGIAGKRVFAILDRMQDRDGSTTHFDFSEFEQNANVNCGAQANAYAGTLKGGMVSPRRTRTYVKRLMWRLEAVRRKAGNNPIGINSGFRSVPYNDCIGGARASQHMYGTAADARQAEVPNRRQRRIAKRSQFHGIGCYSSQTHNHLDVRIDNIDLPSQQGWWWPDRDSRGRDLDESGRPCWGETTKSLRTDGFSGSSEVVSTSLVPTTSEIARFERAGEGLLPEGTD